MHAKQQRCFCADTSSSIRKCHPHSCKDVCSQLSCVMLQVLDDSTDRTTRDLVDDKVVEWRERGVNIEVMRRSNRAGYKAGALKEVR